MLAGLTNLTTLDLWGNHISDISVLAGLTKLIVLNLNDNHISDISALADLTKLVTLGLARNPLSDISALAGLTNLMVLHLWSNHISDISVLAGLTNLTTLDLRGISLPDISALAGLTNLQILILEHNNISDISAVASLTDLTWLSLNNNNISDISPLVANTGLGSGDTVYVWGNPLSYASISTHIPALQSRGVTVHFDSRTPTRLVKISGDQHGPPAAPLPKPLVVEVQDENGKAFAAGVPVTFTVTSGSGTLSITSTTTDANGRAESKLTLGPNLGTTTVEVSAAGIEQKVTFTAVAREGVTIPDSNLRAAVGMALGVSPESGISPSQLAMLTRLNVSDAKIGDLTGLEFATNLTYLYLRDNPLSDISSLSGLTNLTYLYLERNNISDISSLSGLTNLIQLWLELNHISDISSLSRLTNLTYLSLGTNSISDISSLSGLTHLTTLNLTGNNITDISSLVELTHLTYLELGYNHILDISSLSGLTHLTYLGLVGNSVSDISPLIANTGLGGGDSVYMQQNPLSYQSIYTHIPRLQSRGVTVEFDNQPHPELLKISGDNQRRLPGETLANPFVVEAQNERGFALAGISVRFTVTEGGGTLSITNTTTDANGRAQSTLTLGPNLERNSVEVSAAGIKGLVTFHAVAGAPEYRWSIPAGISLIHVPLTVTAVEDMSMTVTSIADLYEILGGTGAVNFLITYDSQAQAWRSYFGPSDSGTLADRVLTDDMGIIAGLITPASVRLSGSPLGTNGSSSITLNQGLNVVGLPLRDSRITRVSDLFRFDGIGGNVPVIILTDGGEFKAVGRPGDPGDIPIVGGQSFIMTAQQGATIAISGEGWYNASEVAAGPPLSLKGIEVGDTTPVLGLRGSIVDEEMGANSAGFRVIVKNLSTGKAVAAVTKDGNLSRTDSGESMGGAYQATLVDVETGRAAQIGDIVEISVRSPSPLVGVQPVRYTVTVEDVRRGLIQLPALVAYEIPAETELLANYPNPFNPETWIPYRLAEDAFVSLTIYDLSGQIVRTLEVGHRIAAVYENRSKAIYWDGRNSLGEQVASGVYFYTLTAGDYSATRKMVILK